jgi:carboxypeptidase C (cathepsin A)
MRLSIERIVTNLMFLSEFYIAGESYAVNFPASPLSLVIV